MKSSAKYHRFAVRCLEEARSEPDQRMRAFLIEMAHEWQLLANQATANDNLQASPLTVKVDSGD
jgi:hypothetical protein